MVMSPTELLMSHLKAVSGCAACASKGLAGSPSLFSSALPPPPQPSGGGCMDCGGSMPQQSSTSTSTASFSSAAASALHRGDSQGHACHWFASGKAWTFGLQTAVCCCPLCTLTGVRTRYYCAAGICRHLRRLHRLQLDKLSCRVELPRWIAAHAVTLLLCTHPRPNDPT